MLGAKKLLRSMQPGAATWLDWDEHAEEDLQGQGEGLGEGHLSGIFHEDAVKALNFRSQKAGEGDKVYKALILTETEKMSHVKIKKNMESMLSFIIDVFNLKYSKSLKKTKRTSETDVSYYQRKIKEMDSLYGDVRNYVNALYRRAWYFYEKQNKLPAEEMEDRIIFARLGGLVFDGSNNVTNKDDAEYAASSDQDDIDISSGKPKQGIKLPAAAGPLPDSSGAAAASGAPAPQPADAAAASGAPAPQPADAAASSAAPKPEDPAAGASPSAPDPAAEAGPPASSLPAPDVTVPPDPAAASASTGKPSGSVDGAAAGPADGSAPAPDPSATVAVPYPFTVDLDSSRPEAQMLVESDFPLEKLGDFDAYKQLRSNLFTVSKTIEVCENWFLSILQVYDTVATKFTEMSVSEDFKNFTAEIQDVIDKEYKDFNEALKAWKVDTDKFNNTLKSEISKLKPDSASTDAKSVKIFEHLSYIEQFYQTEIEKKQNVIKILQTFKKVMLDKMKKMVESVIAKKLSFPVDAPPTLDESNFDTKDEVIKLYRKVEFSISFFKKVDNTVQFYKELLQEIVNHCSDTNVLSQINIDFDAAFTFKLQSENKENIKKKTNFYETLAKLFENWLRTQIPNFEEISQKYQSLTVWSKISTLTYFTSLTMEKSKPNELHGMEIFSFFKTHNASTLNTSSNKSVYELLIDSIQNIFSQFNMSSALITVYILNFRSVLRLIAEYENDLFVIQNFLETIAQEKNTKTDNSPFDENNWKNVFTQYFQLCYFKNNCLSISMSILEKVFPSTPMIKDTFLKCIEKHVDVESKTQELINLEINNSIQTPTDTFTEDMILALKNEIIRMLLAKKTHEKQSLVIADLQKQLDENADHEEICNVFCVDLLNLFALDPKAVNPDIVKPPCEAALEWIDEKIKASTDMTNFDDLIRLTKFLIQGCELAQNQSLVQADDNPDVLREMVWMKNMIEFAFDQNLLKSRSDFFILKTLQYVSKNNSSFDDFDEKYLLPYLKLLYSVFHEKKIIKLKSEDPPLFDDETPVQEYLEEQYSKSELKAIRAKYAADKWALEVFPPVTTIIVTGTELANYIATKVAAASDVSEEIGRIQAAVQACVAFFDEKNKEGHANFEDVLLNIKNIFVDKLQLKGQTADSAILSYIETIFMFLHANEDFPSAAAESAKKDWVKSQFIAAYKECSIIELPDEEKEKGVAFWDWFALCYNLKGLSMYDACAPELWDWVFETDLPRVLMPEVTLNADEVAQNFQRWVSSVEYAARKDEYDSKIRDCVANTVLYNNLERKVTLSVFGDDQQKPIQEVLDNINEHINDIYCFDPDCLQTNYAEQFLDSLENFYNFFQFCATENFEKKLTSWTTALDEINALFIIDGNKNMQQCIDKTKEKLIQVDDLENFLTLIILFKNILLEENLFLFYLQIKNQDDENKIQWEVLFSDILELYLKPFKDCFPEKFVCFHKDIQNLFDSFVKLKALQTISAQSTDEFKHFLESCNMYSLYMFPCLKFLLELDFQQSIDLVKKAISDKNNDDVVQYLLNGEDAKPTLEVLFQEFELKKQIDIHTLKQELSTLKFYTTVKDNLNDKQQNPKYSDANLIVFLDWTMDIKKTTGLHDPFTFTVKGTEETHQKKENSCSEDLIERHDVLLSFFAFVKAYIAFLKLNWMDNDTRKTLCANVINSIQETQKKLQECQSLELVEQAWLYMWVAFCLLSIDHSEFLYDLFVIFFGKKTVPSIFLQIVTDVSSIDLTTDDVSSAMFNDHQDQLHSMEMEKMTNSEEYIDKNQSLLTIFQDYHNFEEQQQNLETEETLLCNIIKFFTFVQKHKTNDNKLIEEDITTFFETFLEKMKKYIRQHDAYLQTLEQFKENLDTTVQGFVSEVGLVSSLLEKTSLNTCKTVRYCEIVTQLKKDIENLSTDNEDLPTDPMHKSIDKKNMSLDEIIMNIFFIYNFEFKQVPDNEEELKIDKPISSCLNRFSMLYYASLKYKNVFAADQSEALPQEMTWPFQVFLLTGIADLLDNTVDKNIFWKLHIDDDTQNALGNKSFDDLYKEGLKEHAQNKLKFTLDVNFDGNTAQLKTSSDLLQELANDSKTASECTASLQALSEALRKESNNFVGYPQISERMSAVNGLVQEAQAGVSKLDNKVKEQTTIANGLKTQLDEAKRHAAAAVKPAAPAAAAGPAGGGSAADAAKIADLERRLKESNDQAQDLGTKLRKSLTELQTEKDALQAANKNFKDTDALLQKAKLELTAANSTKSSDAGEIARLKEDLKIANDKATDEARLKTEAEEKEADVRKDLATANSEIAKLRGEVAALKAAPSGPAASGSGASATAAQIGRLTSEKTALESQLTEEKRLKTAAETARDDAKRELGVKIKKISDLTGEKASAEAQVDSLTKEKATLAAEKKAAEDAKKAAEDAKTKADAAAAKAQADLGMEQAQSALLQTHVAALENWGEQIQGVAKQQYPVYQKITEYYGGLYKFHPPAAEQHLPPKPA